MFSQSIIVSTHSRSKAAAVGYLDVFGGGAVSTHSRSKAAAVNDIRNTRAIAVSTHSRSKAAAATTPTARRDFQSFNSQPLEGGCAGRGGGLHTHSGFQLTAARRRLPLPAAAFDQRLRFQLTAARRRLPSRVVNTITVHQFQLTAARRRLHGVGKTLAGNSRVSTHSRSKAAA